MSIPNTCYICCGLTAPVFSLLTACKKSDKIGIDTSVSYSDVVRVPVQGPTPRQGVPVQGPGPPANARDIHEIDANQVVILEI